MISGIAVIFVLRSIWWMRYWVSTRREEHVLYKETQALSHETTTHLPDHQCRSVNTRPNSDWIP